MFKLYANGVIAGLGQTNTNGNTGNGVKDFRHRIVGWDQQQLSRTPRTTCQWVPRTLTLRTCRVVVTNNDNDWISQLDFV